MSIYDLDLEQEFDAVMRRSGITVPAEWKAGTLAGYKDLRRLTVLLRQRRSAESEPSNAFSVPAILRIVTGARDEAPS